MPPCYLEPRFEHLNKEYVLVQAWKKTTDYIRYHNWFSDTLELDYTTINLRSFLDDLIKTLECPGNWVSDGLHLVPAPKSQQWRHLDNGKWQPDSQKDVPTRPLAHVSLRDQVMATALMLCLADRVESLQGDTQTPVKEPSERKRIISYGNRLYCKPIAGNLRHPWGSKKLYRSYFKDYKQFVDRPLTVAESIIRHGSRTFIVETDLKQFYDKVRPIELNKALARFQCDKREDSFFKFAKRVLRWRWHDPSDDEIFANATKLRKGTLVALPQGLVSAGFFANTVMIGFDEQVMDTIGQEIETGYRLEDACRYVDDLRFVVTVKKDVLGLNVAKVKMVVTDWITKLLKQETRSLNIAEDKTKVMEYGSSESLLIPYSARMNRVQSAVSGGFDANSGLEILDTIQGMTREQQSLNNVPDRSLWKHSPLPDVRNETVLRFSASRFRTVYRSIRPLLLDFAESTDETHDDFGESLDEDHNSPHGPVDLSQSQLDAEAKAFALGLIARWLEDPSNVRLLRIGFDIWPDPEVLTEIIDLMRPWALTTLPDDEMPTQRVVWYCLAELFRAGATETGLVDDCECLPAGTSLSQYQQVLKQGAIDVINQQRSIPWYVQQQALLYIAAVEPDACPPMPANCDERVIRYYDAIKFLQGTTLDLTSSEFSIFAVLARRSFSHRTTAIDFIRDQLTDKRKLEIALKDPSFVLELSHGDTYFFDDFPKYIQDGLCLSPSQPAGGKRNLAEIVLNADSDPNYIFRNELSLLRFSLALVEEIKKHASQSLMTIVPGQVQVTMKDGYPVNDIENVDISCSCASTHEFLYDVPDWCCSSEHWRFQLGFLLRFILTRHQDFTRIAYPWYTQEPDIPYRPVRNGWYQRIYGLFNSHPGFGDDLLAVSDWMEGLLLALLRWPGVRSPKGFEWVEDGMEKFCENVAVRIKILEGSGDRPTKNLLMPMTAPMTRSSRSLRACVVQTVLPKVSDFRCDPTASLPNVRKKHRAHLSAALEAVKRMLTLRRTHEKDDYQLDWLILPELSVHPDDVKTHLFPFARAHKTLILAGLTYKKLISGLPPINSAVWIMPEWTETHGWQFNMRLQGKRHFAPAEKEMLNVHQPVAWEGVRPCQWVIRYQDAEHASPLRLTGSVCYDATDLELVAELRDNTDVFAIPAFNKDVNTFDQMALALHYHMFQLVIIANNGRYGGSNAYAPYRAGYDSQIFHLHGQPQAAIAFFEIDCIGEFQKRGRVVDGQNEQIVKWKHPPAGFGN